MCTLKSSALMLWCAMLAPLFARPTFRMIDLGTLAGNYFSSWAVGINELGEVVGFSGGGPDAFLFWFGHAFLWKNGVMTGLGALSCPPQLFACFGSAAWGINDRGQVVGYSGGATSPFRAL